MKYLISIVIIFLGSSIMNISIDNSFISNIILNILGILIFISGASLLIKELKGKSSNNPR